MSKGGRSCSVPPPAFSLQRLFIVELSGRSFYIFRARNYHSVTVPRHPEPVFVNLLRNPGIGSQPGGPVRQPYPTGPPGYIGGGIDTLESIPGLFKGSLNVYKYGLWLPAPRTRSRISKLGNFTYRKNIFPNNVALLAVMYGIEMWGGEKGEELNYNMYGVPL
jgi:hypothetical protein